MSDDDTFDQAASHLRDGNIEGLKQTIAQHAGLLKQIRSADGKTLVNLACSLCTKDGAIPPLRGTDAQFECLKMLLQAGADVSVADLEGRAPLHFAVLGDHVDLARLLLSSGAPTIGKHMEAEGGSPLALARFYAKCVIRPEMVQILVSADPDSPRNLRTAASLGHDLSHFFTAENGLREAAFQQLDYYRPLHAFPEWQRNYSRQEVLDEALAWASRNGQVGSMQALTAKGACVNSNAYRGTPLLWAIYSDSVSAATWLLDNGADPDLKHDFGGSEHGKGAVALHLAAQYASLQCLRLLLERGADPKIADDAFKATPLGWAEFMGIQDSVQLFQQHDIKIGDASDRVCA